MPTNNTNTNTIKATVYTNNATEATAGSTMSAEDINAAIILTAMAANKTEEATMSNSNVINRTMDVDNARTTAEATEAANSTNEVITSTSSAGTTTINTTASTGLIIDVVTSPGGLHKTYHYDGVSANTTNELVGKFNDKPQLCDIYTTLPGEHKTAEQAKRDLTGLLVNILRTRDEEREDRQKQGIFSPLEDGSPLTETKMTNPVSPMTAAGIINENVTWRARNARPRVPHSFDNYIVPPWHEFVDRYKAAININTGKLKRPAPKKRNVKRIRGVSSSPPPERYFKRPGDDISGNLRPAKKAKTFTPNPEFTRNTRSRSKLEPAKSSHDDTVANNQAISQLGIPRTSIEQTNTQPSTINMADSTNPAMENKNEATTLSPPAVDVLAREETVDDTGPPTKRKRADTPADEVDEDAAASPEPSSKKQRVEETVEETIEGDETEADAFVGKATTNGTTSTAPPDATLTSPWNCANRGCTTGQTWKDRAKNGRKVISEFFGRNKACTKSIPGDVWHTYCRKDYQRGGYNAEKAGGKRECEWKLENIEAQLVRLKIWRPNATFLVTLSTAADKRVKRYSAVVNAGGSVANAELAGAGKAPTTNKKGETVQPKNDERFPIRQMIQFEAAFVSETRRDFDYVNIILAWIKTRVADGTLTSMPPFELLIDFEAQDEEGVTDPADNYDSWTEYETAMREAAQSPQSSQ